MWSINTTSVPPTLLVYCNLDQPRVLWENAEPVLVELLGLAVVADVRRLHVVHVRQVRPHEEVLLLERWVGLHAGGNVGPGLRLDFGLFEALNGFI